MSITMERVMTKEEIDEVIEEEVEELIEDDVEAIEEDVVEGVEEEAEEAEEVEEVEEVIVSIGEPEDAKPTEEAPQWVKDLRAEKREVSKENKRLKRRLEEIENKKESVVLGERPKLADYDYDEDKFDEALLNWHKTKTILDEEAQKAKKQEEEQQREYQDKLDAYSERKAELRVADFEDAEEDVKAQLNTIQQGIIISAANNAALVFYALGKNHTELDRLSKISNPVKFAVELGKVESKLKMTKRGKPPSPEKIVSGNGSKSGSTNKTLERLREEAAKTGDMSKVLAYKRSLKAAS